MRSFALALVMLAACTAACGQRAADPAHAREVAAKLKSDCLSARSQAPNAAFARHLERLCECSYQKVSVMPLGRGDDEHSAKVGDALNACYSELGGEADAGDYRATGIQPPANSSVH